MNETHNHIWTNQWDKRVCQTCPAVEFFNPQEEEENVKPAKAVGKRTGKSVSGEGQVAGASVEETANVGSVEGLSE